MAGGRRKTERRGSLVDERANAQVRSRGLERRARGGVTGVASHLCKRRTQLVRLELRGCARAVRGGARARKEERGGGGERGNGPALGRQTTFEARSHRLGEGGARLYSFGLRLRKVSVVRETRVRPPINPNRRPSCGAEPGPTRSKGAERAIRARTQTLLQRRRLALALALTPLSRSPSVGALHRVAASAQASLPLGLGLSTLAQTSCTA